MAEATDQQMQTFADQRIRVRAEQLRAIATAMADDKQAITDEYARATGTSRWTDARADGPPHLLQAGNAASPDDVLNYNAFATALLNILNGTSAANGSTVAADAAMVSGNWPVLQRACVRPANL